MYSDISSKLGQIFKPRILSEIKEILHGRKYSDSSADLNRYLWTTIFH